MTPPFFSFYFSLGFIFHYVFHNNQMAITNKVFELRELLRKNGQETNDFTPNLKGMNNYTLMIFGTVIFWPIVCFLLGCILFAANNPTIVNELMNEDKKRRN